MNRSRNFGCIFDGKSLHCCIITLEVSKWVNTTIWYVRETVSGAYCLQSTRLPSQIDYICMYLLCLLYIRAQSLAFALYHCILSTYVLFTSLVIRSTLAPVLLIVGVEEHRALNLHDNPPLLRRRVTPLDFFPLILRACGEPHGEFGSLPQQSG